MRYLKQKFFAILLLVSPAMALAQGFETGVFQSAETIYQNAQTQIGVEQATSYDNVRLLLDLIVTQYPGSELAGQIQRGETIGSLNVSALNSALGIAPPAPPVSTLPAFPTPDTSAAPAPGGAFSAYIGRWNDGGRYCAEITESNQAGLAILRLWPCQGDIANSAVAPLVPGADGLRGAAQQVSVRALGPNEIAIDLAAPLFDPFQNQIGPNGPSFSPRFRKDAPVAAPVLPAFPNVEPPSSELTEEELALNRADRREIQRRLTLLGHSTRGVDGVFGPGSRTAIAEWQASQNLPSNSFLNASQLQSLRDQSEALYQEWRTNNPPRRSSGLPAGWWRNSQGQYCRKALLGSTWCQPVRPGG